VAEVLCIPVVYPSIRASVVRPCANTYFAWRDISLISGGILTKLATNIHRVIGHCWEAFQGHRSNLKVIARPDALFQWRHMDRRFAVECHLVSNLALKSEWQSIAVVSYYVTVTAAAMWILLHIIVGFTQSQIKMWTNRPGW